MIAPRPSPDNSTPKPGFPMRPFFGIDPVLVDDKVAIYTVRVCFVCTDVLMFIHVIVDRPYCSTLLARSSPAYSMITHTHTHTSHS